MNIEIRFAEPEDRPAIVTFMAALQAHEARLEENRSDPEEMADPHVGALEEWARSSDGGFLVAENDGLIIGVIIYGVEEEFGYNVRPQFARCGNISDIYVRGDYREHGIGRMLIAAAEEKLRGLGISRVQITTLAENIEARGFYESKGYRSYQVQYAKEL